MGDLYRTYDAINHIDDRIFNLLQAVQPSWYIHKYTYSNFNNFTKFHGEMKLVRGLSYSYKSWFGLEDFRGTNIGVTGLHTCLNNIAADSPGKLILGVPSVT